MKPGPGPRSLFDLISEDAWVDLAAQATPACLRGTCQVLQRGKLTHRCPPRAQVLGISRLVSFPPLVLWTQCLCPCHIHMLKPYPLNVVVFRDGTWGR